MNGEMTAIEGKMGKRRTETANAWGVAHREDKLTKLMNRIESAKQKADKTLISEIPTSQWIKRYEEELDEDGYETGEAIHSGQPRGKAVSIETRILKKAWWGCVKDWANLAPQKTKPAQEDDRLQQGRKGSSRKTSNI